jgi:hypothetical protein
MLRSFAKAFADIEFANQRLASAKQQIAAIEREIAVWAKAAKQLESELGSNLILESPNPQKQEEITHYVPGAKWAVVLGIMAKSPQLAFDKRTLAEQSAAAGVSIDMEQFRKQLSTFSQMGLVCRVGYGRYQITSQGRALAAKVCSPEPVGA